MIPYHETGDLFADTCDVKEAQEQAWSVRTLQWNVSSQILLPDVDVSKHRVC